MWSSMGAAGAEWQARRGKTWCITGNNQRSSTSREMRSEQTKLAIHTAKTESVDGARRSPNVEGHHSSVEHRATFESETKIGVIEGCLVELHRVSS